MEHHEGEVEAEDGRVKIARIQSNHVQNGSLIRQAGYAQSDYSPGDLPDFSSVTCGSSGYGTCLLWVSDSTLASTLSSNFGTSSVDGPIVDHT